MQVVQVPVSDQQVAYEFSVGRLGLSVVADMKMGTLALVPGEEPASPGSVGGLVFETDDIEGDVAALSGRGVTFAGGIEDLPWARAARFADPDGNVLVLQTAASDG